MIGPHRQRSDIQALRAVAVMSVVLYHLWPHRITGGFVGVDVFFVISGFLITGHLVREVERTGRVRLVTFWAARARRLLPASLLTLLVTAVAVLVWVPRTMWEQFLSEVGASAAYFQNWLLASNAVDYLAAENRPSPVQHFWSLSVEEQFYVFLPILLTIGCAAAALARIHRTTAIGVLLVVVTMASLAYSIHLTPRDPGTAYFSTFTRMWEFGIGGLASLGPPAVARLARRQVAARSVLTMAGVAAVALSFAVIDGSTQFPGSAAALPVLGTAIVLRWGAVTWLSTIGAGRLVALLGRISYAMYLWHWPIIVILPFVTLRELTTTDRLAILAATILIAWVSTTFFEEPLRFRWAVRVRPRGVLVGAAVAMVPVLVVSFVGRSVVAQQRSDSRVEAATILQDPPACFGAASMGPDGCTDPGLDGLVVPAAAEAFNDDANRPDCWSSYDSGALNICSVGPREGYELRLAAVGDSHNNALISAYESIAKAHDWRIDIAGHVGCYWTTASLRQKNVEQEGTCRSWQDALAVQLSKPGLYDAVIATHATSLNIQRPPTGVSRDRAIVDGLVEAWTQQVPPGTRVVGLVDNPQTQKTNTECVERYGGSEPERCATPRSVGFKKFDGTAEAVERVPGAALVDMTDFYCEKRVCPSVIGGANVYRDQTHLTDTYARTLAPFLGDAIASALDAP